MKTITIQDTSYQVEDSGYLLNPFDWDKSFARYMASDCGIEAMTEQHWQVINYIRSFFESKKSCPLVFMICKDNNLSLKEFNKLFPTGSQRGACLIAGLSYRSATGFQMKSLIGDQYISDKVYGTDVNGFLVKPLEWDKGFALGKAIELKMPKLLTQTHWNIINYIRDIYFSTSKILTIVELCDHFELSITDLEELFPDGYHRGAVKLAGLRL